MSSSQPKYNWKECDNCKRAGFPGVLIRFEKESEDPATGKIKWKIIEKVEKPGSLEYSEIEHKHKGKAPSKKPRVIEILYQGDDVATVNNLLKTDKNNELFAVIPNFTTGKPAIYIVVRREYI